MLGAASIACLIGHCEPCEAMAQARQRFRCVSLDSVDHEVMANNTPDPAQSALSSPCVLGCCDAFISHSWHDDGSAKHAAPQRWRETFVRRNGREPTVWLDKCCI